MKRITVRWDAERAGYFVSEPRWDGGDVYLASEVDEVLKRQAAAAIAGMNAAHAISRAELNAAQRLRAESSPEALESERQANAILTERVSDLEQACKENARYSQEMREEFERRGADYDHERIMRLQCEERIAELEMYERAVKEHNAQCQQGCGIGDKEGEVCGYRQYFPRRCPYCPVHQKIDIELMVK